MGGFRYRWALPNTLIGIFFVVEVQGPLVARLLRLVPLPGGAAAITFGDIVAARDTPADISFRMGGTAASLPHSSRP